MKKQIQGSMFTYTIIQSNYRLTATAPDGGKLIKETEKSWDDAILYRTGILNSRTGSKWVIRNFGTAEQMDVIWARLSKTTNADQNYARVQLEIEPINNK